MLWRNLKTQFITRFFRIRHDNKMFLYFNVCNSSCSTLHINRQLNIIARPSWMNMNIDQQCFPPLMYLQNPEYLAVEVAHGRGPTPGTAAGEGLLGLLGLLGLRPPWPRRPLRLSGVHQPLQQPEHSTWPRRRHIFKTLYKIFPYCSRCRCCCALLDGPQGSDFCQISRRNCEMFEILQSRLS